MAMPGFAPSHVANCPQPRCSPRWILTVSALPVLCTVVLKLLALLREVFHGPLMAYPNSGYFAMPHWHFVDIMSPAELVAFSRGWQAMGVQIMGGCCGLGVDHIHALSGSQSLNVA